MSKYPVIIFEGIEASGKSTNIDLVSKYLKKIGKKYVKIREPGGSKYSEIIRNLILNKKSKFNYKTDLFLFLASRSENFHNIIKKNYKKKIILIDRFIDSTLAYQHYAMGINKKIILEMNKLILKKFKADLTFLSIVNKKNMVKRMKSRKNVNKYDKFDLSFYEKAQKGFLTIAKKSKNYIILDSNYNSINDNKKIIINKINKKLSK